MNVNVIYIVLRHDKVDEVFTTREAAELHMKNVEGKTLRTWAPCKIIEKELKEL